MQVNSDDEPIQYRSMPSEYTNPTDGSDSAPPISKNDQYDSLLNRTGGFGIFQWMSSVSLISSIAFGFIYFYPSAFYELQPVYLCTNSTVENFTCTAEDWCSANDTTHRINWDSRFSLQNWIEQLGAACAPRSAIGALGSSYFFGWVVSLIFVSRFADKYGRRIIFLAGMVVQCAVYFGVLFTRHLNVMIGLMFVSGLVTGVRMSLGWVYMMEFVSNKH